MSKYINADALISEYGTEIVDYDEDLQKHFVVEAVPTEYIKIFPEADVKEVKHGKWIKRTLLSEEECSNCNKSPKMLFGMLPDYCPWCGAEMDLKEEKND